MACAWLVAAELLEPPIPASLREAIEPRRWDAVAQLARSGLSAPATTSMGRLFDAVAALCGVCPEVHYEGQAAIELEALSCRSESGSYPMPLLPGASGTLLDARDTILAAARDVAAGVAPSVVGARFHNGLAQATARACAGLADRHRTRVVVLSGGVFQNRRLLEATAGRLDALGLRVLTPERMPGNDGGIAYGQAAVAAAR